MHRCPAYAGHDVPVIPRLVRGICALAIFASCSNPKSVEQFVPAEEDAAAYHFTLDLSDTTLVWDLGFYGRIDGTREQLEGLDVLPLDIRFTAPDGKQYGEHVQVPLHRDTPLSLNFDETYRRGMKPTLPGEWELTLTAPNAPEGLTGVGIILNHD
ncbi:MAG: hypothetical protein LIQ26_01850 [Bacteroidota bacterium]|nr:hypothetical protein [Bacteroidota bacterium]